MYSLGQIVRSAKLFHANHKQLKHGSFHYGFLSDLVDKDKDVPGPILVFTRESKGMDEMKGGHAFSVIIADKVNLFKSVEGIGIGNELEVDSNTEKIGNDLIEFFANQYASSGLSIQRPVQFEEFGYQKNSHSFSGWRLPLLFTQPNEHSLCTIPVDGFDIPERVVVMFDGISDNGPPYDYSFVDLG